MAEAIIKIQSLQDISSRIDSDREEVLKIFPKARKKSPRAFEQFYLARVALLECFKEKGINTTFQKLDIINHHYVFPIPGNLVSLSHTEDLGLAMLASDKDFRSIGVDFELADRKIPEGSERFFKNDNDNHDSESPIDLWVIKEACFKCLHPLWKRLHLDPQMILHHITADQGKFIVTNKLGEKIEGHYTLENNHYQDRKLIIAKAYLDL